MNRTTLFLIALVSLSLIISCWGITELGQPEVKEIINGYYYAARIETLSICKSDLGKPPPGHYLIDWVQDFDWDKRFIVAKNFESYERAHADPKIYTWYIVDTIENNLYGPFSYDGYLSKRKEIGISEEVELLRPGEGTFEAWRRRHDSTR